MNNDTIFRTSINIVTVVDSEILPLNIKLKLGLGFPVDADPYQTAIALERVRYTLTVLFQDTIFGGRSNDVVHALKNITNTPIAECWDDPWDQFMALLVYHKVSAVLEDKGFVDFVNMFTDSADGDLEYSYYGDTLTNELSDIDAEWLAEVKKEKPEIKTLWYHRNDTSMNECQSPQEMSWEQLGLVWTKPDNQLKVTGGNNVKKFTPRIIK